MDPSHRIDLDFVLSVLSDSRARLVCYYLQSNDGTEVNELYLARKVSAWETGSDVSEVSTEKVTAVLSELQRQLLPQLHRAGLVAYAPERGTVQCEQPPERLANLLAACRAIDQPDHSG